MSPQNWITFAVIVALCLVPLGIVGYLDWRATQREARVIAANRPIYQDWQRAERQIALATMQAPPRGPKGFDAQGPRRHTVVGFRAKKESERV